MSASAQEPAIPESFLEHRQDFPSAWFSRWTIPNPFVELLFPLLKESGVELTDFKFNNEASNIGEIYLNVGIRKLNAAVRIGLNTVTYIVLNPDWSMATQLIELFDALSGQIQKFLEQAPSSQQVTLAFHVTPGAINLQERTAQLVRPELLGQSVFYGISLHHEDGSTVIDKSLRYPQAAFVRLQRSFDGSLSLAEVAPKLLEDEVSALKLLGIAGVV